MTSICARTKRETRHKTSALAFAGLGDGWAERSSPEGPAVHARRAVQTQRLNSAETLRAVHSVVLMLRRFDHMHPTVRDYDTRICELFAPAIRSRAVITRGAAPRRPQLAFSQRWCAPTVRDRFAPHRTAPDRVLELASLCCALPLLRSQCRSAAPAALLLVAQSPSTLSASTRVFRFPRSCIPLTLSRLSASSDVHGVDCAAARVRQRQWKQ